MTPFPVEMKDCFVGSTSLEASVDCVPHRSKTIAANHWVPLVGATVSAVDFGFWYSYRAKTTEPMPKMTMSTRTAYQFAGTWPR